MNQTTHVNTTDTKPDNIVIWKCPFCAAPDGVMKWTPPTDTTKDEVQNVIMTDSVIESPLGLVEPCQYPSCKNNIPAGGQFRYCEVCRVLAVRNAITITTDPFAPFTERQEPIFQNMICNMRSEEIIRYNEKVEWAYLATKKAIYAQGLALRNTPEHFNQLSEEAEAYRKANPTPKTQNRYEKIAEKKVERMVRKGATKEQAAQWQKDLGSIDF